MTCSGRDERPEHAWPASWPGALQFSLRGHSAWIYWLTVSAVSVAGTEAANGLHTELGLPYLIAALWYLAVLAAVLMAWRAVEKTLSLRSISTPRREAFYWAAVSTAFALGSAVGHLIAPASQHAFSPAGYLALWAAVTSLTALAWWRWRIDPALVFWFAFAVITVAALVGYLARTHRAQQQ